MMVTDLAMRDMNDRSDAAFERFCRWLASPFRHRVRSNIAVSNLTPPAPATEVSVPANASPVEPIDFVRHRSMSACRRALRLATQHRFDEARSAFHTAFAADPHLDPAAMPGFWDLPRRGMFAAIEAYEDLGRYRDAAGLELQILQSSRIVPGSATTSSAVR